MHCCQVDVWKVEKGIICKEITEISLVLRQSGIILSYVKVEFVRKLPLSNIKASCIICKEITIVSLLLESWSCRWKIKSMCCLKNRSQIHLFKLKNLYVKDLAWNITYFINLYMIYFASFQRMQWKKIIGKKPKPEQIQLLVNCKKDCGQVDVWKVEKGIFL